MLNRTISAACFVLLATLPAAYASAADLAGRWYMEGVEDGVYAQFIEDRREDGTFTVNVRTREACEKAKAWAETGSWSLAGETLVKWTRAVASRPVLDTDYYHDNFIVTSIDDDHLQLFDVKTHITWAVMRIPPDFTFPAPAPCVNS